MGIGSGRIDCYVFHESIFRIITANSAIKMKHLIFFKAVITGFTTVFVCTIVSLSVIAQDKQADNVNEFSTSANNFELVKYFMTSKEASGHFLNSVSERFAGQRAVPS